MEDVPLPPALSGALVVAVDDSDGAREALGFAAGLARGLGQPLHVLSVWNFMSGRGPVQDQASVPSHDAWQRHAEERLAEIVAEVADVELQLTVLHGNTIPTLLRVSQVAGHLVVGSRGHGGFKGLLLGSTSEQLVRHAGCPVTVVRSGTVGL